jgi:glycerol-3-phosphate dehydrogenase (NAD+)
MDGKLPQDKGVKAISLIKGVHVEGEHISLFADLISEKLGVSCSALSGANIAPEVARDRFSETTIGYKNKEEGEMWHELFGEPFSSRPGMTTDGDRNTKLQSLVD